MPKELSCEGKGVRPELHLAGIPKEAHSLTLVVDDPDAPGGTFTHWVVWNINPYTEKLMPSMLPEGAHEGVNSFGKTEYIAPCPPKGTHRYIFTLYALDTILELKEDAKREDLMTAMTEHIIAQTELVGLYCMHEL